MAADDDRFTPVRVRKAGGGFQGGIIAISPSGDDDTRALTGVRKVRCWGDNGSGGWATAPTRNALFPVTVLEGGGPSRARLLVAGQQHSCALLVDRTVRCRGATATASRGDGYGGGAAQRRPGRCAARGS